MSTDQPDGPENFLTRWSRVKTEARDGSATRPATAPAEAVPDKARSDAPPPELPPVEKLTLESDFSGFFHPKVDEDMRRAALKKLFSDPHFNVMDGLDVYIDDYSKTEPIPAAMLASLKQAQRILGWAAETEEQAQARRTGAAPEGGEAAPESLAPPAPDTTQEEQIPAHDLDPVSRSKP
jgi:hypothetical protein